MRKRTGLSFMACLPICRAASNMSASTKARRARCHHLAAIVDHGVWTRPLPKLPHWQPVEAVQEVLRENYAYRAIVLTQQSNKVSLLRCMGPEMDHRR